MSPTGIILFIIASVASAGILFRSDALLPQKPFTEDGYYTLSVARNIAAGKGMTIDGQTWTNGFQPLYAFVVAPAYVLAGGDRFMGLRYVAAMNWALLVAASLMVGYLLQLLQAAAAAGPWLTGAALWQGALGISLHYYNGLETGLMLTMYLAIWLYIAKRYRDDVASRAVLGVMLGLLVLTRIDNVFLVLLIPTVAAWRVLHGGDARQLRGMLLVAGIALLISGPWWMYNYFGFGSLMPTSGQAQGAFALDTGRMLRALYAVSENLNPWVFLAKREGLLLSLLIALLSVAALLWLWSRLRLSTRVVALKPIQRDLLLALVLHTSCLIVYYTLFSWAAHHYERYFAPVALLASIFALLTARLLWDTHRRLLGAAATATVLAHVLVCTAFQQGWLFPASRFWSQYQLVKSHVPASALVGAWQSGTLGYFRDNVVNLDGKVNPGALRMDFHSYISEKQLCYICDDEAGLLQRLSEDMAGWRFVTGDNGFILLHAR